MKYASFALLLFHSLTLVSPNLFAFENESHPIVPGFERFVEIEEISEAERGMLLLNELNCNSCHTGESSWSVAPKKAPILTEVGSRVLPDYFEAFLLDPHAVKPGTTMPDVLSGKTDAEKKNIAESIAHFLASTGQAVKQSSSTSYVVEGEKLFHSIGCVACHDPQNEETKIATSIPLSDLDKKYTLPGLTKFIQNPMHVRPSGRMPQFNLTGNEAQSIASHLLRDVVVESKLNYAYYEGTWEKLPDFNQLEPVATGIASGFDVGVGRSDNFGVVFQGYWATSADAKYKFKLSSDDGSRLIINGKTVVDNDGIHGVETKSNNKNLKAGVHDVRLEYFEGSGGASVLVEVTGGGLEGVGLDSLLRATELEASEPVSSFELDPEKVELGKKYFQSVGCASCHEMIVDDAKLASTATAAKPLADLQLENGCLTGASAPSFGLTEHQVKSIVAGIQWIKNPPPGAVDPNQLVHEKLVTLNCYACHNRETNDGLILGGVVDVTGEELEVFGRKKWFTSTQVEIGDEGQHPPALKSVGSKLQPKWLEKVLNEGADDRPYMLTRMPKFGAANLRTLAQELIAVDQLEDVPQITQTEDERSVKAHGRFFASEQSLSCIKCHTFGKFKATGIQAIDLTTMTQRLSKDWFHVYMLKPSKFRRGTRMPESWPGGKSFYPEILDGSTEKQIDALWQFLSDGEKAAKPKGLVRSKMELKAVDSPKIYRNFIEGAGPRAIGVGYPEQVNLAFDAQRCRLALIWHENFIDASRHWSGRGQGFEPPLGENIWQLPESVVFTTSLDADPWPKKLTSDKRPKFKGYRFDKDRLPIFTYQLGDVMIEDQPVPFVEDGRALLKRKFKITSTDTLKLYYRAAVGKTTEINGSMAIVDERFRTGFSENKNLSASGDANGNVIFTIDLSNGPVELEQFYDW